MTYKIFANVYDNLMDYSLFSKWAQYVEDNLNKEQTKILELGSGTGYLGLLLKEKGYHIEGLDLSAEMLAIANKRQEDKNLSFPLYEKDMRDLSDFNYYDAIISFCDTLCYLETKEDLKKVFQEVYDHLEENGTFLFDVFSTEHIQDLDGFSFHDEIPGTMFIWESFAGEHVHSIEHELVFFEERDDDIYQRYDELHKERTYPIDYYVEKLKQTGFSKITVTADFDQEVTGKNTRWFFKAEKNSINEHEK